jgi:type III secretion system FlhB-like substrate exporter
VKITGVKSGRKRLQFLAAVALFSLTPLSGCAKQVNNESQATESDASVENSSTDSDLISTIDGVDYYVPEDVKPIEYASKTEYVMSDEDKKEVRDAIIEMMNNNQIILEKYPTYMEEFTKLNIKHNIPDFCFNDEDIIEQIRLFIDWVKENNIEEPRLVVNDDHAGITLIYDDKYINAGGFNGIIIEECFGFDSNGDRVSTYSEETPKYSFVRQLKNVDSDIVIYNAALTIEEAMGEENKDLIVMMTNDGFIFVYDSNNIFIPFENESDKSFGTGDFGVMINIVRNYLDKAFGNYIAAGLISEDAFNILTDNLANISSDNQK